MTHLETEKSPKIALWLLIVMLMVMAMIVLGGATRLTNSGLSITEWKLITGALPPLSHADWVAEFEKYKQIPEFAAEHPDMDLKGFEFIYFMEWSHRQLGRFIGLVYGLPFMYLALTKGFPAGRFKPFLAILIMIGIQGGVGWWMVKSGFVNDRVDVSQYRLAVHLGLAFIILGLLFWTWRDAMEGWPDKPARGRLPVAAPFLAGLIYVQILAGAFVAGTHSGKTYNTWPLMDGSFVPGGYWARTPLWRNLFENAAAIQFNHRIIAYIIVVLAAVTAWKARHMTALRRPLFCLLALIMVQVILGIWTLLAAAPLHLSLFHQFTAILVFLAVLWFARRASLYRQA